jgi:hypothetical protein
MVFSLWLWPTTKIDGNKNYTSNASIFDGHADTAVQCGVHRPMERIRGFI